MRYLKMVGYYHCDGCNHTWETGWQKSNSYKAAIKSMDDACPKCLDKSEVNLVSPHFISEQRRVSYGKIK
jgi:hypothetical protein